MYYLWAQQWICSQSRNEGLAEATINLALSYSQTVNALPYCKKMLLQSAFLWVRDAIVEHWSDRLRLTAQCIHLALLLLGIVDFLWVKTPPCAAADNRSNLPNAAEPATQLQVLFLHVSSAGSIYLSQNDNSFIDSFNWVMQSCMTCPIHEKHKYRAKAITEAVEHQKALTTPQATHALRHVDVRGI